jgi:hypothetical protein
MLYLFRQVGKISEGGMLQALKSFTPRLIKKIGSGLYQTRPASVYIRNDKNMIYKKFKPALL